MKTIVFQGDSITDADRMHTADGLGNGYVKAVTEWLKDSNKDVTYYNRGISGNRTPDLVARWDNDTLSFNPNIVTLLIGINDINHKFIHNAPMTVKEFSENMHTIMRPLAQKNVKIILMQPFVVRKSLINHSPEWENFYNDICDAFIDISATYSCILVQTGKVFDEHIAKNPQIDYAPDGVHPSSEGIKLLADLLIVELDKLI